jgi:hypothetical protein
MRLAGKFIECRLRILSWFGVAHREDRPRFVESIGQLIARGDYPQKLQ